MHFDASLLSCQRGVAKLFPDKRRGLGWQGSKVITALNDTLYIYIFFFGGGAYYLALRSQEGSVITVALGGQRSPVALLWREGMLGVPSG